MTLTFDIWPWKTFQQFPILVVSVHDVTIFVEINPLSKEIASWEFFMDGQQTDGRTDGQTTRKHNAFAPIVGEDIKWLMQDTCLEEAWEEQEQEVSK